MAWVALSRKTGNSVTSPLASAIFDDKASPSWPTLIAWTIAPSCVIGSIFAMLASFIHNRRLLNRLGGKLGVSRRIGDEDLWEVLLTDDVTNEWLFVRDHKLNLVYFAHPALYSESQMQRELVLTDVSVYNNLDTSTPLYETKILYLSRQSDELTIEVPYSPNPEVTDVPSTIDAEKRTSNARGEHGEERRREAAGDDAET